MNAARARTTPRRRAISVWVASSCCCVVAISLSSSVIRAVGRVDLRAHLGNATRVPRHFDEPGRGTPRGLDGRPDGAGGGSSAARAVDAPPTRRRAVAQTRATERVSARNLVCWGIRHASARKHSPLSAVPGPLGPTRVRPEECRRREGCSRSAPTNSSGRTSPSIPHPNPLFHSPARGFPRDPVDNPRMGGWSGEGLDNRAPLA